MIYIPNGNITINLENVSCIFFCFRGTEKYHENVCLVEVTVEILQNTRTA